MISIEQSRFTRLEKFVLPSIFDTCLSYMSLFLDDVKLAELSSNSL